MDGLAEHMAETAAMCSAKDAIACPCSTRTRRVRWQPGGHCRTYPLSCWPRVCLASLPFLSPFSLFPFFPFSFSLLPLGHRLHHWAGPLSCPVRASRPGPGPNKGSRSLSLAQADPAAPPPPCCPGRNARQPRRARSYMTAPSMPQRATTSRQLARGHGHGHGPLLSGWNNNGDGMLCSPKLDRHAARRSRAPPARSSHDDGLLCPVRCGAVRCGGAMRTLGSAAAGRPPPEARPLRK